MNPAQSNTNPARTSCSSVTVTHPMKRVFWDWNDSRTDKDGLYGAVWFMRYDDGTVSVNEPRPAIGETVLIGEGDYPDAYNCEGVVRRVVEDETIGWAYVEVPPLAERESS